MEFVFADDARQNRPSRPGMGPLVAIGGILVADEAVQELEKRIDTLCSQHGFPKGDLFKWSPGPELWMRDNLVEGRRQEFFTRLLELAEDAQARAIVVIEDVNSAMAAGASSHDMDVTQLFLERVQNQFCSRSTMGIVVIARPSGDRRAEDKFLASCLETLQSGTKYVKPDRIILNPLSSSPSFVRLLQVADVVTSCTTAIVSGETRFAPPVFSAVKNILARDGGRCGGIGLKIHPDFKYANLYHWLVGDSHFWKGAVGHPLPLPGLPYSSGARAE